MKKIDRFLLYTNERTAGGREGVDFHCHFFFFFFLLPTFSFRRRQSLSFLCRRGFRRGASTTRIMFLSRPFLPRVQVLSQSERQKRVCGAFSLLQIEKSSYHHHHRFFCLLCLFPHSNHSKPFQRPPSRRPVLLVRAAAPSKPDDFDLPSTKSGLSKLPKVRA